MVSRLLPVLITLLALLPAATLAASPASAPLIEGQDYEVIPDGKPFAPAKGKIEVVEVFGYTCIHCAHLEPTLAAWKKKLPRDVQLTPVPAAFGGYWIPYAPLNGQVEVVEVFGYVCPACARFAPEVSAWKKKQPADVRVTYVPVVFGPVWKPYAHAFYAAQSKGLVDKSHDAVFSAIHLQRSLPGEGKPPANPAQIAQWYAQYGVDAKEFVALMNSFGTNSQVARGMQFAKNAGAESTPTNIVNGKYRVTGGQTYADVLRIADHLVAMERARR